MDKFRVLLVDDEEELVSALVERLSYRGVMAEYVLNGLDAVKKIIENGYDVVVIDLKMPGMSGVEVVKVIREERPELPLLLITGHGSPADQLEELPEGVYDYLAKPINLEDLIEKMEEAIASK